MGPCARRDMGKPKRLPSNERPKHTIAVLSQSSLDLGRKRCQTKGQWPVGAKETFLKADRLHDVSEKSKSGRQYQKKGANI